MAAALAAGAGTVLHCAVRRKMTMVAVGTFTASVLLPLPGAWLAGRSLAPMLRFPPPLAIPTHYPRFSWLAVALLLAACTLVAGSWVRSGRPRGRRRVGVTVGTPRTRFPWWGWAAVAWTLGWWGLAWTRQAWFSWGQLYTFTPLWLGFILIVNALTIRNGGRGLMQRAPGSWATLFAASAVFWWLFEWLNRFVENWHYLGAKGVGPWEYVVHSSVCFSTVLPAVLAVREWLGTMPRLQARLAEGPAWPAMIRRGTAGTMIAVGLAGLILTGARPLEFYPALWAAPLLIGVAWSILRRIDGWWRGLAEGDWRDAGSWALAALVCGFFWELWNYHSLAKWIYTVPYVERWKIFEMPLPGYAGYLTFGLECALAAGWVLGGRAVDPPASGPGQADSSAR